MDQRGQIHRLEWIPTFLTAISYWENLSISRGDAGMGVPASFLVSGTSFIQRSTKLLGYILSEKASASKIGVMQKFQLLEYKANHPRRNSFCTDWIKIQLSYDTSRTVTPSLPATQKQTWEFDWVWLFETGKWDFNLSTIGFLFFFLLQIWFL